MYCILNTFLPCLLSCPISVPKAYEIHKTFLSLDGGGRALDLPQGSVPCPLLGLGGGEEVRVSGEAGGKWEKDMKWKF